MKQNLEKKKKKLTGYWGCRDTVVISGRCVHDSKEKWRFLSFYCFTHMGVC